MSHCIGIVVIVLTMTRFDVALGATIGLNPDDLPEEMHRRFDGLAKFLSERLGETHELVIADSYAGLRDGLATGRFGLAVMSPLNYVEARRTVALDLLARLEKYGVDHYGSVILVRSDAVCDLTRLQTRTFAYFDSSSTSGYLYPLSLLAERGVELSKLKKRSVGRSHFDVIQAVIDDRDEFGATSTDKFDEARRRGMAVGRLYPLLRSPEDIPFDAVVLSPAVSTERRRSYRRAIAELLALRPSERLSAFPEESGVTGLVYAADADYDVVRRALAHIKGTVLRIGLSPNIEPWAVNQKRVAFRPLQQFLFSEHLAYVDLLFYERDDFDREIDDLKRSVVDLAEFPPVPAGRAIASGLPAILTHRFDGADVYAAFLIHRKEEMAPAQATDIEGKSVAVLRKTSGGGHAYPLFALHEAGVGEERLLLKEYTEPVEVAIAVASGQAYVGVMAEFELLNCRRNNIAACMDVEPIEWSRILVPNGAFVGSARLDANKEEAARIQRLLLEASARVPTRPAFSGLGASEAHRMVEVYAHEFPPDRTILWLILTAGVLVVAASLIFLWWYTPRSS